MKMQQPVPLFVSLCLVIFGCSSTSFAQRQRTSRRATRQQPASTTRQSPGQQSASQDISAQDVKAYIGKSKRSGERWGAVEEKYVLDNFGRSQLTQTIANWQARSKTKLTQDIKIMVMVDYLLTELNGMRILPSVLDSIAKGEPTSFGKQLKTQVAGTTVRQYQAAWIRIDVNIESVDVEIDGKFFGQVPNKQDFTIEPNQSHSVVISNGSSNCSKSITADPGRTVVMPCTLR